MVVKKLWYFIRIILLNKNKSKMGCGSGQKQASGPVRVNTVTGKLKITITNAIFTQESGSLDPYVILKLSNQEKTSKVVKSTSEAAFLESFNFYINSCYKIHGRNLTITVMDKKKVLSDKVLGYGIVDLDPVINLKKPKQEIRCFIGSEMAMSGFVNLIAQFTEQPSKTLSFRFQMASIRRKTSTFGSMNCWIEVVIGEEVLATKKAKDTKETPPTWFNEVLTFNVSDSIEDCLITVYDDKQIIGNFDMPLKDLMGKNTEQSFNEEFQFQGTVNAGTLKFQTLTGINPQFSEIKTVHRKPKQQKEEKKQDKKEDDKKDEAKKEEPKNQEPKKQQPKKEQANSPAKVNPETTN